LRLAVQTKPLWQNRSHFYDRGEASVPLERALSFTKERSSDLAALDVSLSALEKISLHKCKVEIAEAMKVSTVTVRLRFTSAGGLAPSRNAERVGVV
jgi:hypothetical protein